MGMLFTVPVPNHQGQIIGVRRVAGMLWPRPYRGLVLGGQPNGDFLSGRAPIWLTGPCGAVRIEDVLPSLPQQLVCGRAR